MKRGLLTAIAGTFVYCAGALLLPWQSFELAELAPTSVEVHPWAWPFIALALAAGVVALWGVLTRRVVVSARAVVAAGLGLAAWMVGAQADRAVDYHLVQHEAVVMGPGFVIAWLGVLLVFGGAVAALFGAPRWDEATPMLRVHATPAAGAGQSRAVIVYEPRAVSLARELGFADGSPEDLALGRIAHTRLTPEGEVTLTLSDPTIPIAVDGGRSRGAGIVRVAHGERASMDLGALTLRFDYVRQERQVARQLVRPSEAMVLAVVTLLVFLAAGVATVIGWDPDASRIIPDDERRAATIAALTEEEKQAEEPISIDTALVEVREASKAAGGPEGRFGDPEASPVKPTKIPPRNGRMVEHRDPTKLGLLDSLRDPKVTDPLAEILSPDGAFNARLGAVLSGRDESWSAGLGARGLSITGDGDGGPGDGLGRMVGIGPIDTGSHPAIGITAAIGPKQSKRVPQVVPGPPVLAGDYCERGAIEMVVRRRAAAVRSCYEKRLQVDDNLRGKVSVRWTIDLDGHVSSADAISDTMGDSATTQCVLRAVRTMRFAKPDGGMCVVTWPFVFTPG